MARLPGLRFQLNELDLLSAKIGIYRYKPISVGRRLKIPFFDCIQDHFLRFVATIYTNNSLIHPGY